MSLEKTPLSGTEETSSTVNGVTMTMPVCSSCGMKLAHGTVKCPNDGTEAVTKFRAGDCLSDKYEFLESVGSGGMGIIHKAKHLALNRIVAIKLLHPHLLNPETIMRFQREARTASKLSHPNLIQVQDVGTTDDGQPFMVMDFAGGKSLSELIQEKGRLTVDETLNYFVQICSGLAYAHKQNILHRDLKPSNVMLVEGEHGGVTAKILDFGIAKVLEDGENKAATLTRTGDVFGSPLYMSPEQCAGGTVDRRSDCYSLGCMLYECLTGSPPYMRKTVLETLMAHAQQEPLSLKEATLGLDFPKPLNDLVMKLLAKSPEDRYQSVLEIREDLQAVKDSLSQDDQEEVLTKRALRDNAGGDGTVYDAKKNGLWHSANGKDITIAILSLAVLVLVGKDIWLSCVSSIKNEKSVDVSRHYSVQLGSRPTDADDDLRRKLEEYPSREEFELRAVELTDSSLPLLRGNQRIKSLDFQGNSLNGSGLTVAQTIPNLIRLNVSSNPLSDQGIQAISQLSQLKNLEIKDVEFSPRGLLYLGQMKNLDKLEMDACEYDVKLLGSLSNMPALEELSLNDQKKLSDRAISKLRNLPNLRMVDVSATKVSGKGFEHPGDYPFLERISLKENQLSEDGFKALSRLKNLKELDLRLSVYDAKWFAHLKKHPNFSKLRVSGTADTARIHQLIPRLQIETD